MAKMLVRAVTRPGYDGAWRAGRKWLSGEDTEVEVVEQDDDPGQEPGKGLRVGKKTFEILKKDPNIVVRAPGDPLETAGAVDEAKGLKARVAELEAQLAAKSPATAATAPHAEGENVEARRKRGG
jgi:hypothetical protein